MMQNTIEKIVSLCKRRGFIFQSSDIYGGFSAVYDYGPLWIALKNNISEINKAFNNKNSFKGKIGIFDIENNTINHRLNFYKIEDNSSK